MIVTKKDRDILRELGKQKFLISQDIVNNENVKLWTNTNDLKMIKPPIYIDQLPWNEVNVDNELTLLTESHFCRQIEEDLRREIYRFKHLPGSMVVSPFIESQIVVNDSGFGIEENVDVVKTDESSEVVSRHFNIQIKDEEDIHKIKDPIISLDEKRTEENYNTLKGIFEDVIDIKKVGSKGYWFTPWDNLIRLMNITETMMDLILRPEFIDALVERFVDASMIRLDQYEKLQIWSSNNDNTCVGSGGYGYCSDLESTEKHKTNAPLKQLWGCGNAQIFSEVSPAMHWNFSLKHELRWLERFGLSYYGCCEPLHNKMSILEKIPNLRKISMSPWAKLDIANEIAKEKYVLSCKPNPAIFAEDRWRPDQAKEDILNILRKSDGCSIELICKDISTVRYQPQRLWDWAKIAQDTINEYFG